jgi:hypothetical protein
MMCMATEFEMVELQLVTLSFTVFVVCVRRIDWRYKNNRTSYSRQSGTVKYEYGLFKLKCHELPFHECEGRLISTTNAFGLVWHRLILTHPSFYPDALLFAGRSLDEVLGSSSVNVSRVIAFVSTTDKPARSAGNTAGSNSNITKAPVGSAGGIWSLRKTRWG